MNYKSIQITAGIIASIAVSVNLIFAQDSDIVYTKVFSSVNITQWELSGLVTPNQSDQSLSFIFPYDENAALQGVPDTVVLTITDHIDLSGCSTAYVRYNKTSDYPNKESWIISDVYIYTRHEFNHRWVRVFEDISDLAGWIHELELQFRIVIKTDQVYPSTLQMDDIRIEGACSS